MKPREGVGEVAGKFAKALAQEQRVLVTDAAAA